MAVGSHRICRYQNFSNTFFSIQFGSVIGISSKKSLQEVVPKHRAEMSVVYKTFLYFIIFYNYLNG